MLLLGIFVMLLAFPFMVGFEIMLFTMYFKSRPIHNKILYDRCILAKRRK